jgi:NAD(P)-dependent dehydrogenase (short-subunit alcohol dehydrogenase family)
MRRLAQRNHYKTLEFDRFEAFAQHRQAPQRRTASVRQYSWDNSRFLHLSPCPALQRILVSPGISQRSLLCRVKQGITYLTSEVMEGVAMRVALVTGASRGLGLALARALAEREWTLVIDGRGAVALDEAAVELSKLTAVHAVAGDVADPNHRRALLEAVGGLRRLDLLVNNASVLGPSPQPGLADYPLDVLEEVYRVNAVAPLALIQLALPYLEQTGGRIINITSDAAVEGYEGWGGYGSSKAALEQLTNVLAAEHPGLRIFRVDPGDLRTRLHQEAFPGEDISDRPLPDVAVPGLLALIDGELPSGRYRAQTVAVSS